MNEPLLHAATEIWIPTQHVFQFNGLKLCLTLEEFDVITGKHDFSAVILPTLKEDLSDLAHQLLGVPLAMAKRWYKSDKLNVHMVFKYFSQKDVPLVGVKCSHHLNTFCLSILTK